MRTYTKILPLAIALTACGGGGSSNNSRRVSYFYDAEVGNYALASRALETALAVPAFFGGAFLATVAQTGARSGRAAAPPGR